MAMGTGGLAPAVYEALNEPDPAVFERALDADGGLGDYVGDQRSVSNPSPAVDRAL